MANRISSELWLLGAAKTLSTMVLARKLDTTTFLNMPVTINRNAREASMWRGSARRRSCGRNSVARTIGPATRCGKNDRYTAKRISDVGLTIPRYVSMTYDSAWKVKNEMPTGSATPMIVGV